MTYENVLEVFADCLSQDDSCKVLQTSRGPLVCLSAGGGKGRLPQVIPIRCLLFPFVTLHCDSYKENSNSIPYGLAFERLI